MSFSPTTAFIQGCRPDAGTQESSSFVRDELDQVRRELISRGIPVRTFQPEEAEAATLSSGESCFVAGDLMVMWRVLKSFGLDGRIVPTIPAELSNFLHRRVWSGTISELYRNGAPRDTPVFVKPYYLRPFGEKRLKGQVVASLDVIATTPWIPANERLICAEVVTWVAEYRAYVLHSRILGVHLYATAIPGFEQLFPDEGPDLATIEAAVKRLDEAGASAAGYCLDFGILETGETALVEVNDGLALTNYGVSTQAYTDLHIARWHELMLKRKEGCEYKSENHTDFQALTSS